MRRWSHGCEGNDDMGQLEGTQLSHVTCHRFKVITSQCHEPCHECHNTSNIDSRPSLQLDEIWDLSNKQ